MSFKPIISKKDKEGNQYIIISEDGSVLKSNLDHNEIIIARSCSNDCPINRDCIDYIEEDSLSRYCEHFVSLFQITPDQFSYESLFCNKNKMYHEISVLKPIKCPLDKDNCLDCIRLLNIIAVPYPEESNYHIVCD